MSFTVKGNPSSAPGGRGWYSYVPIMPEPMKKSDVMASYAVCTCGAVKACAPYPPTGHSDWCSVNDPAPETEEMPF